MKTKIILYIVMMVLLVSFASALGLAPSRNVIDFTPNLEKELSFRIMNTEHEDLKLAVYPRGELAEYIELEKNIVILKADEEEVVVKYTVKLPKELEPGLRGAEILVIPIPEEKQVILTDEEAVIFDQQKGVVAAKVALMHQLRVNVPYPGKYLNGQLYISEANVNETVAFTISLFNLGKEDINKIKATIIVKGPTNEEIAVIRTEEISLVSQDESKIVGLWKANVGSGKYVAEAVVDYDGKTFLLSKVFYVGNLMIEIERLKVDNFRLGTIAKFDILLRSKWNEPIPNVFANMQVIDKSGTLLTDFKTAAIEMQPYQTAEIYGYWDTQNVQPGEYDVNVKVNYLDKVTEKLFETVVSFDSIDVKQALAGRVIGGERKLISDSVLVLIVLILIGINIGWFIYFKKRKR